MTIHIPKWLLWVAIAIAGVGILVAAYLAGRADNSGGSSAARSVSEFPCTKRDARQATRESGFAVETLLAGQEAVRLGLSVSAGPEGAFFDIPDGFWVEELECRDFDGNGTEEMVVGLGAGASGWIYHWAVVGRDGEGDWRTEFSRHGVQTQRLVVRDGVLIEFSPAYEGSDPFCCPSGQNATSFDFINGAFGVKLPPGSRNDRLIIAGRDGIERIGLLSARTASPVDARVAFGAPSYVPADPDEICEMTWSAIGLSIAFANLGGQDSCGPNGRIGSFALAGDAAEQAGWEASSGARIGMGINELLSLYPVAGYEGDQLVLSRISSPFGETGVQPALSATIFQGRAIRISGYGGAAGE